MIMGTYPEVEKMKKGFTLIELIVVIAIIGVLSAIVAPSAFRAIEKSKISKIALDFKNVKTAWLAFYGDTGKFPSEFEYQAIGIARTPHPGVILPDTDIARDVLGYQGWDGPYYSGNAVSPWAAPYRYDNEPASGCYDSASGANAYAGVNVGINEGEFTNSQGELFPSTGLLTTEILQREVCVIHRTQIKECFIV